MVESHNMTGETIIEKALLELFMQVVTYVYRMHKRIYKHTYTKVKHIGTPIFGAIFLIYQIPLCSKYAK